MLQNKLFRKAALDKLSSPERLDEMMRVTSPAGWLAAIAVGVIIVGIVVWGFVGRVTTRVAGQGILLQGGSVLDVTSGTQGRLTELLVSVGDIVEEGQVIATLEQVEMRMTINSKKAELDQIRSLGRADAAATNAINASRQAQIRDLEARKRQQEELLAEGLITPARLNATESEINALRATIAGTSSSVGSASARIAGLAREIQDLEAQLVDREKILSPYTGKVLEINENAGSLVSPGRRIMTLEPIGGEINAYIYIPAKDGKKVVPGMTVRISPSTVKSEEYGFIIGEVIDVSDYPMSPQGLERVLRNASLAQSLSGDSPPIQVVARPLPDESTPSGYQWSSSEGPPTQVFTGTICTAQVEVEEKKPVEFVLPIFKSTLGITHVGGAVAGGQ